MAQAGRRWQRTIFLWLIVWNDGAAGAPRLQQSTLDPASSGASIPWTRRRACARSSSTPQTYT
eukprot:2618286-Prymnesium_polylepis.1